MTADDGSTEWGPEWLTKTRLAMGIAAVLAAAAVWVFNAGGNWRTVSEAPMKADSALELADSALDAIEDLRGKVQNTNRAVKILGCEGMDLEPVASAQLQCSDLTSSIGDTISRSAHSSPSRTSHSSAATLGGLIGTANASPPDRSCLRTLEDALRYVRSMSEGGEPRRCRGAAR